ncbi:MAG: EFR1 family ferrodoxin [Bacteroidaceae bacterium]|nr:EFR1 family ferrodoxin [Bacteroidaceae bacterium]
MIYYFSGTGNSLYVARHLADALGEKLCPMALSRPLGTDLEGPVGLVFPVYGWGIPNVVEKFVSKQLVPLLDGKQEELPFLYAVMTCGDDMGYTDRVLEKALGRQVDAAFSVLMPDVYVCLPGFDVDSKEECREKFEKEKVAVPEIAACVKEQRRVRLLKRGPFPWTKTYILRPLFNRFLVTDKYFKVDASKCISCGRCSKMCPVGNILIENDVPRWQSHCAGCLACYHACPYHAINFGKMTQTKGQYNIMEQIYE